MPPVVDDATDARSVTYPRFDHGEDLYVMLRPDGRVEFQTGVQGQFVKTDAVVDVRDEI